MSAAPLISVCIMAYNRAAVLPALLESIVVQDYDDFEIVICEDMSPERPAIGRVVADYTARLPGRIRYFENVTNLGYDANLRNVIERARGKYCLFMNNDDLLCPGAVTAVASALKRHENIGVILRSYASFDETPDRIKQEFRYFETERFFPAGTATIATIYRRSVVNSGMVLHREQSIQYATDRFDGSLLYQLYLVASILTTKNAVFLPQILALYRNGGIPDFGNSEAERGKFVPQQHTPESSLHFMGGMLDIARHVQQSQGVQIYDLILRDIGNYSYPVMAIQADKPFTVFVRYCVGLAKLGFWKSPMFYIYCFALVMLGPERIEAFFRFVKRKLGYTPLLGKVYKGRSV